MNSKDFFNDKSLNDKWKNKSGIYVIEQPLFSKELGYQIMKVGYASNSLYTRVADYKTTHGPMPFKIHALYHIPEKVVYKRARYALVCEAILHKTLKDKKVHVEGEWFKNLKLILNCVNQLRENHLEEIKKAPDWIYYNAFNKFNKVKLVHEDSVLPSAFLKNIISIDREQLTRKQSIEFIKGIVGKKGILIRNNESVEGTIEKYSMKTHLFEVLLETDEEIELTYKEVVKFVGLMDDKEAEKNTITLRSGKEIKKK